MRFSRTALASAATAAVTAVALTAACASAPAERAHPAPSATLMLSGAVPDPSVFAAGLNCPPADREELITKDQVTGQRNTIVIATNPEGGDNNWPPQVTDLTWSPNDAQLALELAPTAAISSVQVLGAFTATSINDATPAPASCPIAEVSALCTETDPAYLAGGGLSYAIASGGRTSLVTWRDGHRTVMHVFAGALSQQYDMTAQGQAIWIRSPSRPFTIWCWSGGPVTEITALPTTEAPVMVAWLLFYSYCLPILKDSCLRRYAAVDC